MGQFPVWCGLTVSPLPDSLNKDNNFSLSSFNIQDTSQKLGDPFAPNSNKLLGLSQSIYPKIASKRIQIHKQLASTKTLPDFLLLSLDRERDRE